MKKTFTYISGFILIAITTICVVEPSFTIVKQLSEYTVHIMFVMLGLGLLFLILDRPKMLFISFLCTGILALFLKEASNTALRYPDANVLTHINIAHFNLSNLSHDMNEVLHIIETKDPDIITFQEYTPEWKNILSKNIKNKFEFSRKEVRIDPFGMAVYSKYPLKNASIINYKKIPNLQFGIDLNDHELDILLSYVLPPVLDQKNQTTEDHLTFLGDAIQRSNKPTIVLGDFNMVYWSNEITKFRGRYKLNNSRKQSNSFGLSIPYDHMFFTNELECTSIEDLANFQGEHIGIYGVFQHKIIKGSNPAIIGYINQ